MAAKKIDTTTHAKSDYAEFLGKAKQFFTSMSLHLQDKEWDAVVLLGVHAAISATDAVLVFQAGKRSISKNHHDAVSLLQQHLKPSAELNKNANRLSQIINAKKYVEYEPKRYTENEAKEIYKQVERYLGWIFKQLP